MHEDPRMRGFNYSTGWGAEPKPATYLEGIRLCRRLSEEALGKAQEVWALEMALRNVRLATTGVEKGIAVAALHAAMAKYHNQIAAE